MVCLLSFDLMEISNNRKHKIDELKVSENFCNNSDEEREHWKQELAVRLKPVKHGDPKHDSRR